MIAKGILFGDIHSYYDLNLILSGSVISPAKPKTNYIDVPGRDGAVDLTEANGEVKYYDRDCKFTFTMHPSGDLSEAGWEAKKTEVSNAINGKRLKITLDKDSDFYYVGRCTVDEYASNKRIRQIVVTAKVEPYKYKQKETVIEVLQGANIFEIYNSRKTVCPIIECVDCYPFEWRLVFNGAGFNISEGTHKFLDIQFVHGANKVGIIGSEGKMIIRFREGDL